MALVMLILSQIRSLTKLDEHEAGNLRIVNVQVERKSGEIVDATAYQAYEKYVKEGLAKFISMKYLKERILFLKNILTTLETSCVTKLRSKD